MGNGRNTTTFLKFGEHKGKPLPKILCLGGMLNWEMPKPPKSLKVEKPLGPSLKPPKERVWKKFVKSWLIKRVGLPNQK